MASQSEQLRRRRRRRRRDRPRRRLARGPARAAHVVVLDARRATAPWRVAAGMLAPVTEADVRRARAARPRPARARRLPRVRRRARARRRASSRLPRSGTLVVARDRDEAEELERVLAYRRELGLAVERLRPQPGAPRRARAGADGRGSRSTCPATTPSTRARCVAALAATRCERAGRRDPRASASTAIRRRRSRRRRSRGRSWSPPAPGRRLRSAALPGAPGQGPDPAPARPAGPGPRRRARSAPASGYLVPRGDGRYVLGATVEERGFDTALTAGATLRAAARPRRGRARRARARDRGARRRPAPRHARQPAAHRPRRATASCWPPATTATASCCADVTAEAVAERPRPATPLPELAAACDPARFAEVAA